MKRKSGVIKWFSKSNRYGFIVSDEGKDYFFHENFLEKKEKGGVNIQDRVSFVEKLSDEGYRAVKIKITEKNIIHKFECGSCHANITPRLITGFNKKRGRLYDAIPKYTICSECHYIIEEYKSDEDEKYYFYVKLGFLGILIVLSYLFYNYLVN
jgi:cold shock CspA family protein